MPRQTDSNDAHFFRMNRFFRSEGLWYFKTREGVDIGPFVELDDGTLTLDRFLDTQKIMRRLQIRDVSLPEDDQWSPRHVAEAAQQVAGWRFDSLARSETKKRS